MLKDKLDNLKIAEDILLGKHLSKEELICWFVTNDINSIDARLLYISPKGISHSMVVHLLYCKSSGNLIFIEEFTDEDIVKPVGWGGYGIMWSISQILASYRPTASGVEKYLYDNT